MIDEGRTQVRVWFEILRLFSQRTDDVKIIPFTSALPTKTHMALVALQNAHLLKHIISQNCDGLHVKSGIKKENISELHGNAFMEYCEKCGMVS